MYRTVGMVDLIANNVPFDVTPAVFDEAMNLVKTSVDRIYPIYPIETIKPVNPNSVLTSVQCEHP